MSRFAACSLEGGDLLDWAATNISLHSTRARLLDLPAAQLCLPSYHTLPLAVPTNR